MSILVLPIAIITFGKINHFAYETKSIYESLLYIALQFNTVAVWLCVGGYWFYPPHSRPETSTFNEILFTQLLGYATYLEAISIFLYTLSFVDVVVADIAGKRKIYLTRYKKITIWLFPLICYILYFILCLT